MTDSKYRFNTFCLLLLRQCGLRIWSTWGRAYRNRVGSSNARSPSKLSFEGILDFWNGIDITSIEYCQYVNDGKVQVKAKPLKGPKREFNRTDETLSINFSPDDALSDRSNELSGNSLSRLFPPDVATLSESYDIAELPGRTIADRDTVGVSIMPKQADRHGFKIWIDKSTALLLRMEMCDCDDARRLSMLQFTEIKVLEGSVPALTTG